MPKRTVFSYFYKILYSILLYDYLKEVVIAFANLLFFISKLYKKRKRSLRYFVFPFKFLIAYKFHF